MWSRDAQTQRLRRQPVVHRPDWPSLPPELWHAIFGMIIAAAATHTTEDILPVAHVCRRLHALVYDYLYGVCHLLQVAAARPLYRLYDSSRFACTVRLKAGPRSFERDQPWHATPCIPAARIAHLTLVLVRYDDNDITRFEKRIPVWRHYHGWITEITPLPVAAAHVHPTVVAKLAPHVRHLRLTLPDKRAFLRRPLEIQSLPFASLSMLQTVMLDYLSINASLLASFTGTLMFRDATLTWPSNVVLQCHTLHLHGANVYVVPGDGPGQPALPCLQVCMSTWSRVSTDDEHHEGEARAVFELRMRACKQLIFQLLSAKRIRWFVDCYLLPVTTPGGFELDGISFLPPICDLFVFGEYSSEPLSILPMGRVNIIDVLCQNSRVRPASDQECASYAAENLVIEYSRRYNEIHQDFRDQHGDVYHLNESTYPMFVQSLGNAPLLLVHIIYCTVVPAVLSMLTPSPTIMQTARPWVARTFYDEYPQGFDNAIAWALGNTTDGRRRAVTATTRCVRAPVGFVPLHPLHELFPADNSAHIGYAIIAGLADDDTDDRTRVATFTLGSDALTDAQRAVVARILAARDDVFMQHHGSAWRGNER